MFSLYRLEQNHAQHSAPLLEEIEEIGRVVAVLRGRAMQQVRRFLAMLARMRKDLTQQAGAGDPCCALCKCAGCCISVDLYINFY
jgi:hypothetical protein